MVKPMIHNFSREIDKSFWAGKKVFITGHTGFKGSWLSLLLIHLGCDVFGYSSSYPTNPCLFKQLQLDKKLTHYIGDIRDDGLLKKVLLEVDPYSSSKAAAELAISSWRSSFFSSNPTHQNIFVASARSGNVIGGGDWSDNRIVPDIIRSLISDQTINLRNPNSTRPWQHVLDPLVGYLLLAESLSSNRLLSHSFNFGPSTDGNRTVLDLVEEALKTWPGTWNAQQSPDRMHEANLLNLATELAHHELSWFPRWNFSESIFRTINWYKQVYHNNSSPYECCMNDVQAFLAFN